MLIVMMGTAHPHLQASEASAPGGGNQRFPRNEGGRGGAKAKPTLPPAFRRGSTYGAKAHAVISVDNEYMMFSEFLIKCFISGIHPEDRGME